MKAMNIVGMVNAGYVITEAVDTEFKTEFREGKAYGFVCHGFCIGHNGFQYVTWGFTARGEDISFYHGHYMTDDRNNPARSKARAKADLYERVAEAFARQAEY